MLKNSSLKNYFKAASQFDLKTIRLLNDPKFTTDKSSNEILLFVQKIPVKISATAHLKGIKVFFVEIYTKLTIYLY